MNYLFQRYQWISADCQNLRNIGIIFAAKIVIFIMIL